MSTRMLPYLRVVAIVLGFALSNVPPAAAETCPFNGDGDHVVDPWEPTQYFSTAKGAAALADGSFLLAGTVTSSAGSPCASYTCMAIARYNADGCRDTSYGTGGISAPSLASGQDYGNALALQGDGKALIAGKTNTGKTFADAFLVSRFNSNGSVDSAFGSGGWAVLDIMSRRDAANSVGTQSAGGIILGGESENMKLAAGTAIDSVVARFRSNGQLDTGGFGQLSKSGRIGYRVVNAKSGYDDRVEAMAIQPDDKIVTAGYWNDPNFFGQGILMRFTSQGDLDGTFGSGGISMPALGGSGVKSEFHGIALQGDGKIVAAGTNFIVARFLANGSLDTSFNAPNGYYSPGFGEAQSVAIQGDGKIVAGGFAYNGSYTVLRLNGDGTPDVTFGANGVKQKADTAGGILYGYALVIQPSGYVILAGERRASGGNGTTVNTSTVRFWP